MPLASLYGDRLTLSVSTGCWLIVWCLGLGLGVGPDKAAAQSAGASQAHWAHPEAGMPLVETYTPEDYDADSQNWKAIQDGDNVLHVANTRGVLTFDGAEWALTPVANRSIVRGLAEGADGRIYVGAQDELGYLTATDQGRRYISLRAQIEDGPDDLGNIWNVEAVDSTVYFHSYEGLYRWSIADETMHQWTPAGEDDHFFPMTTMRDTVYVASREDGLHAVVDDSLRPAYSLPPSDDGTPPPIRDLAPYGEDQVLIVTASGRFYVHDGTTPSERSFSFADQIGDALPYDLNRLSDGTYALSTIGAGLFLFDADGTLIRHFSFPNQPVLSTYEDHEGGVWVTLDSGLRRIDWNTPLSIFSGEYDDETITDVVRHNDTLTVSTNHGMGTIVPGSDPGDPATLQKRPPLTQIWNLHQSGSDLLIGASSDLYRWQNGDQYEELGLQESHAFRVTAPPQAPSQLYVSTARGIERFEQTDASWTRTGALLDDIGNFSRPAWANDSTLWVGTRYAGVVRIQVDAEGRPTSTWHFTTANGLPEGHVMPFRFGDTVFFSTEDGAHRFDEDADQFERVNGPPYMPGTLNEPRTLMAGDGTGRWWGNTNGGFGWWTEHGGDWTWQMRSLRRVARSVIRAALAEDDVVWLATDSGLLRYQPDADTLSAHPVLIRKLSSLPSDSTLHAVNGAAAPSSPIDYAHNSLRLRYAMPSFTMPHTTEYRVRLSGMSDTWSRWTTRTQRDFTNLAPGPYTFEVQARTARGTVSDISRYAFTVLPPWYRTWWAYVLYVLGGLGLLAGVVQWRTLTLRRQQRHLEQIVDDRTAEISRKNEKLAHQAERLQSLDEAKSQFFANISHELRTPLTLILGPVRQLLQQHSTDSETTHRLSVVERNAERLLHMVQQLLGLARLEAGTLDLNPRPCALGAHLAQHARTFVDVGTQHDVKVYVEHTAPPDTAAPAYADLEYMEQVVSNLMSNAIKFTPAGGHVMVRIHETETETRILVSDTGIGIAEAHHQTIFERFQQVDGSATRPHEGAGIGLALTKDLVEAHGGRITVDSALGDGSTFTVLLPRGRAALPERYQPSDPDGSESTFVFEAGNEAEGSAVYGAESTVVPFVSEADPTTATAFTGDSIRSPSNDGSARAPGPPKPSRGPLLLIVDDNADMRAYVRSILAEQFQILEAENGHEGLEQATEHLPDLILADVMMPGMDGLEMTRQLRSTAETSTIPIIMVTARADTSSELQGLSDGAHDYITKPFDPAVLQMRVHGMMQWMQRLKRELRATQRPEAANTPSDAEAPDTEAPDTEASPQSEFERKARAIVQNHITEHGFDVDDLAEEMAVSRSTLYRRARSNDAPSPAALVREVRMNTAHELLEANKGTVTEVAYAVGYESLSSFSDQFRSHFGYSPSQVATPTSTQDA